MTIEDFKRTFETLSSCEEKSRAALDYMKELLASEGGMQMSAFWEVKRLCMEAFKGEIGPIKRSAYWKEFVELTEEAKRLKEILDEQTKFAYSQIELAVTNLQSDLGQFDVLIKKVPKLIISKGCKTLQGNANKYVDAMQELTLIKTFTSRYQHLRSETIETEMRMGQRNRLLKKLSGVGDRIFDRRKELIEEVSTLFVHDVHDFVERNFLSLKEKAPFRARREIQLLQEYAKKIALSRKAFSECRTRLAQSWEALQDDLEGKKDLFRENKVKIEEEIKTFLKNPSADVRALITRGEKLTKLLSKTQLSPDDYKSLSHKLKKGIDEAIEKVKEEKSKKETKTKEKIDSAFEKLESSLSEKQLGEIKEEIVALPLSKNERAKCDHLIATREEELLEAQEKQAIKKNATKTLLELLDVRQERFVKLKDELEELRREMESSSFDFEKAMVYRELYEAGKRRLARAEASVAKLKTVCR